MALARKIKEGDI